MKKRWVGLLFGSLTVQFTAGCANTSRVDEPRYEEVRIGPTKHFSRNCSFHGALPQSDGTTIGVTIPALVSFIHTGYDVPDRSGPPSVPSLSVGDLTSVFSVTQVDPDVSEVIAAALRVNADPQTLNHDHWRRIKDRYPAITHALVTVITMSENGEYKPGDAGPYLTYSTVEMKTHLVDLETARTVATWEQVSNYASDWDSMWITPEELANHHKPLWIEPVVPPGRTARGTSGS